MNMSHISTDLEDSKEFDFVEERAYLDTVESRIDALISRINGRIAPVESKLPNWHAIGYEDVDRKRIAIHDLERFNGEKAEIESYKPEPYYCHFEVIVDGKRSRELCIGNHQDGLRDDNGTIVLGRWAPLRVVCINKTQTQFDLEIDGKKHSYELRLRRMVQIKNGSLVEVNTEYDSADATLEGEVADPFLIAVLHDKRRDFKLSDIVRTIQQNQNEILERPVDESFIVQGCAGSGKTMILLHRLSYLAFNHPEIDFSKYIVLTPNESFNSHIDELCEELNIGSITRLTVESYYVRLARRLARKDTRTESNKTEQGKQIPKIIVQAENVIPEFSLPTDYLSEVYSVAFANKIAELFNNAKANVIDEIEDGPVGEMLLREDMPLPDRDAAPYETYLGIVRSCSRIKRNSSTAFENATTAREERDEAAKRFEEASTAYSSASELLDPVRTAVLEKAVPLYSAKKQELEALRREATNAKARKKNAETAAEQATAMAAEIDEKLAIARAEHEATKERASQEISAANMRSDPQVIEAASKECAAERAEVDRIQSELNGIGIFSFGRRRAVREELEQAESRLQSRYEEALRTASENRAANVRSERARAIGESEARLSTLVQSVTEAKDNLGTATERLNKAKSEHEEAAAAFEEVRVQVEALKQPVADFKVDKYPNLSTVDNLEALEAASPELAEYVKKCKDLTPTQARYLHLGENRVKRLSDQLEAAQGALEVAEEALAASVDVAVLEEAERLASMLDATVFDALLEQELSKVRSSYHATTADGESYRHELYLKALECVLYYGPAQDDKASICVDEAQDLSPAELGLIRTAIGPKAALNLYGDTNQLIYAHKGIRAWSELPESIAKSRYNLNENYRNTLQITEYCNERLDMNITAIGLKGSDVAHLSLQAGIDEMFALKGAKPNIRCAVIYKRGLSGVKDLLSNLLGADASFGQVDTARISVIPIDAAKGLEFDAVVVIDNEMSENERYLSFSRALDHLVVTHIDGATMGKTDEISSEGGRTIGASKLKEAAVKATAPQTEAPSKPEEPADPFFDLDFS